MCCGKISKRARSCGLSHWAPESDGRLTFGRIWSLCVSVQSGKNRKTLCVSDFVGTRRTATTRLRLLSEFQKPFLLECLAPDVHTVKKKKKKLPVQWGGSQWMHDKAEQIDRLISEFTCIVAAAAVYLTTQWLIVRDQYHWPPLCHPLPRCSRKHFFLLELNPRHLVINTATTGW